MAGTAFNSSNWAGYDAASWTNPSSALTDFSGMIDISTLSASWKAEVQSDGFDIRVTKSDNTELPLDVIDFVYNAGAPTGWIRFKYTGTLASSGTQTVRVWAGYSGTAVAYDANETYGADNAYDSAFEGYWPDGGSTDRTVNGNDATANGTTAGGSAGKVGTSTEFNADGDDVLIGNPASLQLTDTTLSAWVWMTGGGAFPMLVSHVDSYSEADSQNGIHCPSSDRQPTYRLGGTDTSWTGGGTAVIATGAWKHILVTRSGTAINLYQNGVLDRAGTNAGTPTYSRNWRIGNWAASSGGYWPGFLDEVQIHSAARSAAWIAEEYAQTNNQSTFWGTWTWTAAAVSTLNLFVANKRGNRMVLIGGRQL